MANNVCQTIDGFFTLNSSAPLSQHNRQYSTMLIFFCEIRQDFETQIKNTKFELVFLQMNPTGNNFIPVCKLSKNGIATLTIGTGLYF